jgi:hypothetical protein
MKKEERKKIKTEKQRSNLLSGLALVDCCESPSLASVLQLPVPELASAIAFPIA